MKELFSLTCNEIKYNKQQYFQKNLFARFERPPNQKQDC